MKKLYAFLLLISCAPAVFAQTTTVHKAGLSPLTRAWLQESKKTPLPAGYVYRKQTNGQVFVSSVIKVYDAGKAGAGLKAIGAVTGTKAGNIWTVQVPLQKVDEFIQTEGIDYIQLDEPVYPKLDAARKTTRADSVQAGYNLPMPYSGKDVIVGVIDFGFDYNHPTFYDTTGSKYRIKKVWELNGTGTPPAGYSYGNEITDTTLIKAQGTDNMQQTHGTATAGMAAGSGFGGDTSNRRFRGMAFGSDLVLVGVRRDSIGNQWMQSGFSDFIDGINYIFNYAASVSKPAVVNISWGSQSGPHDGSSLFNQACDNLSGAGKLIVMSAGNEGQENIHLAKTFTATDTVVRTLVTFTSPAYKRTWIDVWGDTGKTFCGAVTLYQGTVAGNTTGFFCLDNAVHDTYVVGTDGDTCFVQFITSTSEFNSKPRLIMNIWSKTANSISIAVKGNDGAIDAWDEYYYYGYTYGYQSAFSGGGFPGHSNGNNVTTVSDMGAGQSILLVGAYASKIAYTDINGHPQTYSGYVSSAGKFVPFSSRGPMIDGRIKPDITAPGLTIATAVSSYDTAATPAGTSSNTVVAEYVHPQSGKHYYYAEFIGTSASAPAASGIVALLLQAKPDMTPQQLKDLLFQTAIKDSYTGSIPAGGKNDWGNGKINAYGAMKLLIQQQGIYNFSGKKLDCILFPNPGNGNFTLDYTGNKNEELNLRVYNVTGSMVASENWQVYNGLNRRNLDLSKLSPGNYLVSITGKEGAVTIKTTIQ